MKEHRNRVLIGIAILLYVLHSDWWNWNDARLVLGLPVGLLYHLIFCFASAIVLLLLIHGEGNSKSDPEETRQ